MDGTSAPLQPDSTQHDASVAAALPAQKQQKHAPVELVNGFVPDGKLVAEQHLVGSVVKDTPAGGGFGRAGGRGRASKDAAQREADGLGEQVPAKAQQQRQMEVGQGLVQPTAARMLRPGRPAMHAEREQPAKQGQTDEQEQCGRGACANEEQEQQARLAQQRGRVRRTSTPEQRNVGVTG